MNAVELRGVAGELDLPAHFAEAYGTPAGLAMEIRREIGDPVAYRPPGWWGEYPGLRINPKNFRYPSAVAEVLDVLTASHWEVARAAVLLGVSTSALVRFLREDPHVWERVNRMRTELGMKGLRE